MIESKEKASSGSRKTEQNESSASETPERPEPSGLLMFVAKVHGFLALPSLNTSIIFHVRLGLRHLKTFYNRFIILP